MRHALAATLGIVLATGACTSILGNFDDSAAHGGHGGSSAPKACSLGAECAGGEFCDTSDAGGTCAPRRPQGAACGDGDQCTTGACVDDVCCDGPCAGACMACEASLQQAGGGGTGVCSPAADGAPDPQRACPSEASATCGMDGKCKGGACEDWPAGTPCDAAPPTCAPGSGGTPAQLVSTMSCDGAGACSQAGGTTACSGYTRCAGDACSATCAAPSDCATGYSCMGGTCLAGIGTPCHAGSACQSGFCADGVCCNTSCSGPCMSCGTDGTCNHVSSGPSPAGHPPCAAQPTSTCGLDGTCHDGACERWANGTPCGPGSCSGGMQAVPACDGKGTCQAGPSSPCGAFACNPAGTACNTSCSSSADCASGHVCVGTHCM